LKDYDYFPQNFSRSSDEAEESPGHEEEARESAADEQHAGAEEDFLQED
jgi:hypothetical protein